jgi:hypothetical protein
VQGSQEWEGTSSPQCQPVYSGLCREREQWGSGTPTSTMHSAAQQLSDLGSGYKSGAAPPQRPEGWSRETLVSLSGLGIPGS